MGICTSILQIYSMYFPHLHSLPLKIVKSSLIYPQRAPHRPNEADQEGFRVFRVAKVLRVSKDSKVFKGSKIHKVSKPPTNIASGAHQNFFYIIKALFPGNFVILQPNFHTITS